MAHNFKLTGDYYVSVDGSDSNDGLTPDTPKRTFQAGLNLITTTGKTLIAGAGVYRENISRTLGTITANVYADGHVILDGNTSGTFDMNASGLGVIFTITFYGFNFKDWSRIRATGAGTTGIVTLTIENSVITNSSLQHSSTSASLRFNCINTVFINCSATAGPGAFTFTKIIIINCNLSLANFSNANNLMINCYVNASSNVLHQNTTNFNYNNIEGGISATVATAVTTGTYQDWIGQYYDLTLTGTGGTGTIGDPYHRGNTATGYFFVAEFKILYPTSNVNSFSADPMFNNIANLNFTLQAGSPHIKRANDGGNIGGTEYAVYVSANDDEFDTDAVSVINLVYSGADYVLATGMVAGSFVTGYQYKIVTAGTTDFTLIGAADSNPGTIFTATGAGTGTGTADALEGEVISAPIFLQWPRVRPLDNIHYEGLLEFNKAITPPASGNQQVPAATTYVNPAAGANPDRLKIYMRYSTQQNEPATSGEWDNGSYYTAGSYQLFELNTKPQIDGSGLGNGDPSFVGSGSLFDILPTWIQPKVVIRNNYIE
jgi:hypothetical protein